MHATLPLLADTDFPTIRRGKLETIQVNLGYRCNQSCLHCHVNAGPRRKESMDRDTAEAVLDYVMSSEATSLDITGGAPELNEHFRFLVTQARAAGIHVMDRCNLSILTETGQEDLAAFLAEHQIEVIASLPCYSRANVDAQRGDGVFEASLAGLRQLNALGYGAPNSKLVLNLVYNPAGPSLPPAQCKLEADYKRELAKLGIRFNRLYTLANMPIQRFGSTLISRDQFAIYLDLLRGSHRPDNLGQVMCRSLVSIDWQGHVYDCDFNQMLGLAMPLPGNPRPHVRDLMNQDLEHNTVVVADHCYGCTAGQGSGCGGALD